LITSTKSITPTLEIPMAPRTAGSRGETTMLSPSKSPRSLVAQPSAARSSNVPTNLTHPIPPAPKSPRTAGSGGGKAQLYPSEISTVPTKTTKPTYPNPTVSKSSTAPTKPTLEIPVAPKSPRSLIAQPSAARSLTPPIKPTYPNPTVTKPSTTTTNPITQSSIVRSKTKTTLEIPAAPKSPRSLVVQLPTGRSSTLPTKPIQPIPIITKASTVPTKPTHPIPPAPKSHRSSIKSQEYRSIPLSDIIGNNLRSFDQGLPKIPKNPIKLVSIPRMIPTDEVELF
jgi:hypothetical protein